MDKKAAAAFERPGDSFCDAWSRRHPSAELAVVAVEGKQRGRRQQKTARQ